MRIVNKKLKYKISISVFTLIAFISTSCAQKEYTSFTPGEIWKDTDGVHINAHGAGVLTVGDMYYMFGEHKVSGSGGNQSWVGVRVYSSKDLYNWKNEGVALKVKKDKTSKLVEGSVIERPKVIYNDKTKKYVMWFHHELKGQGYDAALVGVAVSDTIIGPYEYIDSFRMHPNVWPQNFTEEQHKIAKEKSKVKLKWGEGSGYGVHFLRDFEDGQMSRDMTLFKDDDGTAYHITASEENGTLIISKLSPDYLSLSKEYIRVFPGGNNEAPAIFKKDGKYFMITSGLTGWDPNPARSAMADNMLGDWIKLGNPVRGTEKEKKTTFYSQSTHILPVLGKKDAYIFMADRWRPKNAIDGRYVWLPIEFEDGKPIIKWYPDWNLDFFDK
ncbi:glycoside hydrolase family 43 protein [Polaribacter sp. Hel_I_88]|uniref:glycoside hydrolase family 43 protein n=1 Tax=Polaribacter sp. Hel_I_88 TaxID=1250006 RepID=UPI00047E4BB7|nr:glycoside hydrolase family 43 protein [Polaribacter sp. Hel_I_88]